MFEINQRVWSNKFGWGVVIGVDKITGLIAVNPDRCLGYSTHNFWIDGREDKRDLFPSLFHDEVKQWPNPAPPKPDLVGNIFVSNDGETWYIREFVRWNDNKVVCKHYEPTLGMTWNYYKEMKDV